MEKVTCCCLRNGAPSRSYFKPSLPYTITRSTSPPLPPCRRSIFMFRCILNNPKRATGNSVVDVTAGRNTRPRGGFSFDFEQYMSANGKAVNEALDRALPVCQPERLNESMRYSVLAGGKRVRPILAIAACELVGGSAAAATPVACAVEMVHTMSLIHDDMPCMDDDALRRGRPANHVAFGENTALLSGDALLALAFGHLARGCADLGVVPAERALRAVAELGNAAGAGGVAAGQVADKASEGKPVSLAMLEYIHLHKTARLIEAAAVCGAIVGGGTDGQIESVRRYARSVGLLFQVVDDVLDVTRTSEQLGKTAGKDQAADKATYPKLMGVEQAQAYMAELLAMAEAELQGFDAERAAPLHHLARFIAYRQN
ncbi:geranylgeranyl pyrophosphate synthase 7, chloroplastic [Lolium perenne]|uniref:geranylgeranyl pyrophosphate synthase 7, chloroplastic n=1 Tax=Lolium perenne TaxID=4522 RepID=UPI0021EA2FCF|nr:geranylgeranyl pyrophosphate synthase 7, chloroplastic-like [Lolium perenne]